MDVTGVGVDVLTATEALLERWRARPDGHTSPREDSDRFEAWDELRAEVGEFLARRQAPALIPSELARIERWLGRPGMHALDAAHAVAWGIDDARHADLTDLWTARLAATGPRELRNGELAAVTDAPEWALPDGARFSSHPNSYKVADDDLPHLRRFRSAGVRVVVDATLDAPLAAVLETLASTGFATVHPNVSQDEVPRGPAAAHTWPMRPRNPARQLASVRAGLAIADAGLVVLPELTVTAELVEAMRAELDEGEVAFDDRLIVAGSAHEARDLQRHNVGYLLVPGAGAVREYRKNRGWRGSAAEKVTLEGIHSTVPPIVTVYTAGRYTLAALICLDMLDPDIVHALGRLGVTLVAVPALSSKTDGFVHAAHGLIKEAQSLVVVANGPVSTSGALVIHGRPVETVAGSPPLEPVVTFPRESPRPSAPGVYRHSLRSTAGDWRTIEALPGDEIHDN